MVPCVAPLGRLIGDDCGEPAVYLWGPENYSRVPAPLCPAHALQTLRALEEMMRRPANG